jgi:hypothetical protein
MARMCLRRPTTVAYRVAPGLILLLLLSGGAATDTGSPRNSSPVLVFSGAGHVSPLPAEEAGPALSTLNTPLSAASVPHTSLVNWINITAGLVRSPSARSNASVAYDSLDNLLLLYGGENGTTVLSDTWEFVGGAWVLISASSTPGPRYGAGLAYDPIAHYFVLFGGNASTGIAARTWLFESGHWVLDPGLGQPKPREFPAFNYDPAASAVVMFGGLESGNQSGQVWWFANGNWTAQTIGGPGTPSHRAGSAFFWYQNSTTPLDSGMILFGGYSTDPGTDKLFRDTWIYSNANGTFGWSEEIANSPPPARSDPAVAFDPSASATLMFGGFGPNGGALGDAWLYNASGWTTAPFGNASHPGARGGAAMALAPIPGKPSIAFPSPSAPLLVGGSASARLDLSDTWFLGPLPLSLLAPLVPPVSDVDTVAQLSVTIFNQGAPVAISWSGLPPGCTGGNRTSFTCEPNQVGGQTVSVTVSLGSQSVSSSTSNWTVNSLPRIALFTVLPSPSVVGKSTTVQVGIAVGSGTAPFTFQYLGLPGGCSAPNLPQFSCSPTTSGSFEIEVIMQDADGQSANALTNLTVAASSGSGATPLWEYAAEGLGALVVILIVLFIVRSKVQPGGPRGGMVRTWEGPQPALDSTGSPTSPSVNPGGADNRT